MKRKCWNCEREIAPHNKSGICFKCWQEFDELINIHAEAMKDTYYDYYEEPDDKPGICWNK